MLQALAIIAIIVALPFRENKSPPPTTPFISFSLRLSTLKFKLPHPQRNDCLAVARPLPAVLWHQRKIIEGQWRFFPPYLLFTQRQKHFKLVCLEMFSTLAATLMEVRGETQQSSSHWVWHWNPPVLSAGRHRFFTALVILSTFSVGIW